MNARNPNPMSRDVMNGADNKWNIIQYKINRIEADRDRVIEDIQNVDQYAFVFTLRSRSSIFLVSYAYMRKILTLRNDNT